MDQFLVETGGRADVPAKILRPACFARSERPGNTAETAPRHPWTMKPGASKTPASELSCEVCGLMPEPTRTRLTLANVAVMLPIELLVHALVVDTELPYLAKVLVLAVTATVLVIWVGRTFRGAGASRVAACAGPAAPAAAHRGAGVVAGTHRPAG